MTTTIRSVKEWYRPINLPISQLSNCIELSAVAVANLIGINSEPLNFMRANAKIRTTQRSYGDTKHLRRPLSFSLHVARRAELFYVNHAMSIDSHTRYTVQSSSVFSLEFKVAQMFFW